MMQKRKFIKWLALAAILSVSLSQLLPSTFATEGEPIVSPLADETEEPDNRPKISIDYLGISPTPGSGPPAAPGELPLTESGVVFWVGVSVDKLSQVDFIRDTGLYGLEIAFDYNPDYVEPWCDLADNTVQPNSSETVKSEAWRDTLKAYNFTDGAGKNDSNVWDSTLFELVETDSVRRTEIDIDPYREEVIPESWKMSFVSIQKKADAAESAETNRFQGVADDTAKYILKMPFYLRDIPANGAKPLVFKLSRGPSTLVMNSGANGYENFAAWEKEDRSEPPHNLKKIFAFGGDLNIFGGSSDASTMTDLIVTGEVDGSETTFDKYGDNTLGSVVPYTADRTEYYVRVPAEISEVTLTMAGLTEPPQEIRHSDNSSPPAETVLTASPATGGGYMVDVTLVDVDMSKNNGFNNTVTINLGDTSYFVYIQKLVHPRIELAYGNSPVGMIMADDEKYADEAAKTAAIDAFQETRTFSGVTENRVYNEKAWESYTEFISNDDGSKSPYDGDLDPYAMVLFQRRAFKDVGFSATDSLGNAVAENQITRTMQVIACNDGVPTYDDTRDNARTIDISINEAVDYLAKDIMEYNIRPNVYIMKYSFTDALTGAVEIERKVIIISELGDAIINANDVVNALDGNAIVSGYSAMQRANSLYAFRVCDALMNANNVVNALDGNTVVSSYNRLQPFYNNLYKTFNKDYFKNLENN